MEEENSLNWRGQQKLEVVSEPDSFERNWNYIKESLFLMLKRLFEYKLNFYASLVVQIIWYFSQFLLIFIISNNFGNTLGWTQNQFLIYLIVINFIWLLLGILNWGNTISSNVVRGNFNTILARPLSHKIKFYFLNLDEDGLFFSIANIFYTVFMIVFFNIHFENIFLGSLFLFVLMIYFTLFWTMIDSFNLYSPEMWRVFYPIGSIEDSFQIYPSTFFNTTSLKFVLNILPLYFAASLIVPIFSGVNISLLYNQIIILIFLIVVAFFVLMINWHYGLKRYEAFG